MLGVLPANAQIRQESESVSKPASVQELSQEDLYFKVFGIKPSAVAKEFVIKGYVNGAYQGEIPLTYMAATGAVTLNKEALISLIKDSMIDSKWREFDQAWKNKETVSDTELNREGIQVKFEYKKLRIDISFPPEWREKTVVSVVRQIPQASIPEGAWKPRDWSGYFNVYSGITDQNGEVSQTMVMIQQFNSKQWITKSQWSMNIDDGQTSGELTNFEIQKDLISKKSRLSIGKVAPRKTYTLSQSQAITGIKIGDYYQLDPDKYKPFNTKKEVILTETSAVEIRVNGRLFKTYYLSEGKYEFQHFPSFVNRSTISIIVKPTRSVDGQPAQKIAHRFDTINNALLLKPGQHEYDIVIGESDRLWTEATDGNAVLAAYSRVGVTPFLSLGTYGQLNEINQGGVFGVWGTPLGFLRGEWSANQSDTDYWSFRADYLTYELSGDYGVRKLQTSLQYNGRSFNSLESTDSENTQYRAFVTGYFNLPMGVYSSLNGFTNWDYTNTLSSRGITLTLDKYFKVMWLKLQWISEESVADGFDWSVLGKVTYSFPSKSQRITLESTRSDDPGTFAEFRYNKDGKEVLVQSEDTESSGTFYDIYYKSNKWRSIISLDQEGTDQAFGLSSTYKGNRGRITSAYRQDKSGNITKQYQLESALVFTSKSRAFSTPVQNNFVIVKPHESIKNNTITFSRGQIDRFGPAVITDLPVYKSSQIIFKEGDLDLSVDFGKKSFYIYQVPGGGVEGVFGQVTGVTVLGWLEDASGQPIIRTPGRLVSQSDPKNSVVFFTSRKGQLQIPNVMPGEYILSVAGYAQRVPVTVGKKTASRIDLGRIKMEKE